MLALLGVGKRNVLEQAEQVAGLTTLAERRPPREVKAVVEGGELSIWLKIRFRARKFVVERQDDGARKG